MYKRVLYVIILLLLLTISSCFASEYSSHTKKPVVAILPIVDRSGSFISYGEEIQKLIYNNLDQKFPNAKFSKLDNKVVGNLLTSEDFENAELPIASELVSVGKKLNADYVVFVAIDPVKLTGKASGFIIASQKIISVATLKIKYVDVIQGKYLYNKVLSETAVNAGMNIGPIGGVGPKSAVMDSFNKCLKIFDQSAPVI